MVQSNTPIANLVGGELSPTLYGRTDLPTYKRGVARAQNFLVIPQGPGRYRQGTMYVHHTRRNKTARFIPFQFNDTQAYLIEVTDQYFRFYKDNSIIVEADKAITGATQANPCVVTCVGHGYATGDEAFIDDVAGMTQLNGKSYVVTKLTADTFSLSKADGTATAIDSTGYTAYSSGGNASRVYEIVTPYLEADFDEIQYAQNTDTMKLDHQFYEPRELTRTGHTNWSLARYARTADPFTSAKTITAITAANPGVITTSVAHGRDVGDEVYVDSVVGMTEINSKHYLVNTVPSGTTLTLKTMAGVVVDTSAYTAYASGGKLEHIGNTGYPRAVTFTDDGRCMHAGTAGAPESFWASCAPTSATTRYNNFTTGTNATDAVVFTLAPVHGQSNAIQWLTNTDKFIVAGTFGTIRRIYGATEGSSITPSAITAKSVNAYGAHLASPVSLGTKVFYIQRGKQLLRSFQYDYVSDGYQSTDRNLVADHLTAPGLDQIIEQQGRHDLMWAVRSDGVLLGLVYQDTEDISGWQRLLMGGSHHNDNAKTRTWGKVLGAGTMARDIGEEQLWLIVERYVNGITTRSVEYFADFPNYPDPLDFYTGQNNEAADLSRYENYKYEVQKTAIHLDAALTYDGSLYGEDAAATLTPSAITGTGITLTASAAVFTASMVGRQVWKNYDENGDGGGRAEITAYTSSTVVTATVLKDFDNANAMAAGEWRLTAETFSGLDHLEGETVGVQADGGPVNDVIVTGGSVTLENQASVIHVGYKYLGILKTLNVDAGGVTGSAQTKKRNVAKTAFRFLDSAGVLFGTSMYGLEQVVFHRANDTLDRPTPLFSGVLEQPYQDSWDNDKSLFVVQDKPLPCTVSVMDVYMDTSDE